MKRPAFTALATFASGLLFGLGLAWATMIRPESVLAFLTFQNLGLLLVLGAAVAVTLLVYQLAPRWMKRPLGGETFQTRPFTLSRRRALGGVLFGLGWGICGICPGPALAGVGAGSGELLIALAAILGGALLHGVVLGSKEVNDL
ncbi:hypothetical protein DLREEDagrD3_01400 [Denitratisoma sp. agr-D3]